jgi:transcriptional regulator with XRE-family HTH domain
MLRVEYERRLRGMSQASLAEALGVSQSLVSHVERGGPPGRHVALKIQRLFELPTPEACVEEVR